MSKHSRPRDVPAFCNGKLKFLTFTRAEKAATRSMRAKGREGDHMQAYHCSACGAFHVGTWLGPKPHRPRPKIDKRVEAEE